MRFKQLPRYGTTKSPEQVEFSQKMRALRNGHDQLERSVVDLAWRVYKIRLYKADATQHKSKSGRPVSKCTPGLPDRIGVVPPTGRFLGIEIKTGKSRKRSVQVERSRELEGDGALVFVVRSMAQAEEIFSEVIAAEKAKFTATPQAEAATPTERKKG